MHTCLHGIASLELAPEELATLSAMVLLQDSSVDSVVTARLRTALHTRLSNRCSDAVAVLTQFSELKMKMRAAADRHMALLQKLRLELPDAADSLPALYKELVSADN